MPVTITPKLKQEYGDLFKTCQVAPAQENAGAAAIFRFMVDDGTVTFP